MSIFRTSTFWGAVTGATLFGALIVWGVAGWSGQPSDCTLPGGNCYCETPAGPSLAKQPANTWSNLVPFAAGLAILVIADIERARRRGNPRPAQNSMLDGGFYAIGYGFVVLLLGPGSAAFHASLTNFGGFLDNLSMFAFIGFVLVYDAFRIARADDNKTAFAALYLAILTALGAIWWLRPGSGILVFAGLVAAAVLLELVIAIWGIRGVQRPLVPWLALGLGTFAVALLIWRLSWTGAPLCDQTSLLQGHALWHILAEAAAPLMFFAHFRREIRTDLPAQSPAQA
jgi:hypothetical protein